MIRSMNIGHFSINLYSICILLGIVLATIIISNEAKKFNMSSNVVMDIIFWGLIFGIIGARIYYVIFNLDYYSINPIEIIKIWNGGLAIHGGIIAGLITIILYCKKHGINKILLLDILIPGVIIAQSIGRWGNFFNQEAHGGLVSKAFLKNLHLPKFIIDGMYIGTKYYHPTFLYESILCLIGFLILILIRKHKKIKTGNLFSFYLIWYGIIRFFIESLRTDSLMFEQIKVAQLVSVLMIIIGIILFVISLRKNNLYRKDKIYNDQHNL